MSPSTNRLFFSRNERRPFVGYFLFWVLALWLISISSMTRIFFSSPGLPTSMGMHLFASAAPVRPLTYPPTISNTVGCVVCQSIAAHALLHLQKFMEKSGKTQVASFEVEDFLDNICDPDNIAGAWIRRIGLAVVPDEEDGVNHHQDPEELKDSDGGGGVNRDGEGENTTNRSGLVHLEVRQLSGYAKCQRVCVTVRDYCLFIREYSTFDDFSREVAALSKNSGPLFTKENENILREKVCSKYFSCIHKDRIMMSAARDLNADPKLRCSIENDPVEIIPLDQLPKEFSSSKKQKMNEFVALTVEEIETLQAELSFEDENAAARRANREYALLNTNGTETLVLPKSDDVPKENKEIHDTTKIVKKSRFGRFSGHDL